MDKSTTITSPITQGSVNFLYSIPKTEIIANYLKESKIDVSYLFKNIESISLYECIDTGYRFFYPFEIDGDGQFYEQLEQIPWYYADWKWDYDIAEKYIHKNTRVLDIGCGEGKFLSFLKKDRNCDCVGLELNEKAKQIACQNNLVVKNEFIQTHAESNKNMYDIVTFFQVLEHISQIDSFIKAAIEVVKPGGKIILAVPNNEPYYLSYDKDHFLNLPPHHMGWWNEKSLVSLAKFYQLDLVEIIKQPLEHYTAYTKGFLKEKLKFPSFLIKMMTPFAKIIFYLNRKKINGASIMVIYQKR